MFDVQRVNSHGGSLRIFVCRQDAAYPTRSSVDELDNLERSLRLDSVETYINFEKRVNENRLKLQGLLRGLKKDGHKIAAYGAPAKGNTLLNYMEIGTDLLEYVVDDSPYKQGLYTPGMHIPVVSSQSLENNRPDYLFILAWNFAEQIMVKCSDFRNKGGRFILPVPEPKII
ncbi:MAG: hypothetical protein A3B99_04350 [Candidatus Yanofskybacteria bacterium RIFCSPHIGHO2_02_FULL_44_12b]|uniref:C-methyltransferase domain-containing protein n=2 Tax=Candidatus Yanofskyibacteriota TaxID=1752733 RepID=A0A1F8GP88_9BACT|nr:MAG: NDP-hexose 3-C-methyltransferase [Candidatus Yanofskybacteria bacterium GW2011_GWA2_44_9]OGN04590.1 MAG: hypothetical protein A2659_00490 [Candidatus Yanofskybacteria bacterium RIFCSPHIGHO2_01_FULL_44_24]OGN15744.1 MAG: hypothetical protein A3B99_04350 [Candidatus Yanofskybacteria bacterium RIFCSPHIGHO2_02_FULL_44_12b]OGN26800.1 MAG: hypothetical protein A2925_04435 [Candidatus Yanofskybacteria bacterium RIFCSPLOWO2_01_FULL_44_22]